MSIFSNEDFQNFINNLLEVEQYIEKCDKYKMQSQEYTMNQASIFCSISSIYSIMRLC